MPSPTVCANPTEFWVICPRCRVPRKFVCLDGQMLARCGGCEWYMTFGTQAPTGGAPIAAGQVDAARPTTFLAGQVIELDTSQALYTALSAVLRPFTMAQESGGSIGTSN
jgi:hypothetical protein